MRGRLTGLAGAAFLSAFGLAGCGYMGQPLPPALKRPVRVTDLAAVQRGSNVIVQFTIPKATTEDIPLKGDVDIELRVGPPDKPFHLDVWQHNADRVPVAAKEDDGRPRAAASIPVPARKWYGKTVDIAVNIRGPSGNTAGWSNFVILPVIPALAMPEDLQATDAPNGVHLEWRAKAPEFRIFRKLVGEPDWKQIGTSTMPSYTDTIEYGKTYQYRVQAVQKVDDTYAESEISDVHTIKPEDRFPPAVPAGLSAIPGSRSIELVWERNTEKDFGTYRVYRDGTKVAEDLTAPAYSDRDAKPGVKYSYRVSAVDTAGNESAKTAPVEAAIP